MRIPMIAALVMAVPAAAWAGKGKPSAAEAKQAAQAWLDAMKDDADDKAPPAAIAASTTPFYGVAVEDGPDGPQCPESTAADAAALGTSLLCLHGNVQSDGKLRAWKSKDKSDLGSSMRGYLKTLQKAKDETLVVLDSPCAGTYNFVIFGAVRGADGAVKIAGVISLHGECGE